MEFVTTLLKSIQGTAGAAFIQQSPWAFPTIEAFHVIAIALVVGTIAMVDLRLLGLASTNRTYTELSGDVLPWTRMQWRTRGSSYEPVLPQGSVIARGTATPAGGQVVTVDLRFAFGDSDALGHYCCSLQMMLEGGV